MLKIIFAATPDLACPSLQTLFELEKQGDICLIAVLTKPDQAVGRKRILQPSPIKAHTLKLLAKGWQGKLITPEKLTASVRHEIAALQPDLLAVFAYGKIFHQRFLDLFPLGGINLHPSALPQWRGPSPIEAQLLAGATNLTISIQRISLEMDAGDILEQEAYPLPPGANYFFAAELVAKEGASLLRRCCENLLQQNQACPTGYQSYLNTARPQQHQQASYCQMLKKDDGRLNWNNSALQISLQCRAYVAWPKAHTWLRWQTGKGANQETYLQINILDAEIWQPTKETMQSRLEITQTENQQSKFISPGSLLALHPSGCLLVSTGDGILAIWQLQRQNKNACSAKEFANQLQNNQQDHCLPKWSQLAATAPLKSIVQSLTQSALSLYCFKTPID